MVLVVEGRKREREREEGRKAKKMVEDIPAKASFESVRHCNTTGPAQPVTQRPPVRRGLGGRINSAKGLGAALEETGPWGGCSTLALH